jgi:hypothetical protein
MKVKESLGTGDMARQIIQISDDLEKPNVAKLSPVNRPPATITRAESPAWSVRSSYCQQEILRYTPFR